MNFLNQKQTWVMSTIILFIGYMVSCKSDALVTTDITPTSTDSNKELRSVKATSEPTIDGYADLMWDNVRS
jgi:hypothetical protein